MIRVYFADVSALNDENRYRAAREKLSPERKERADRLRFRRDQALCVGAGLLLDYGLRPLGFRERAMRYGFKENGKPYFPDAPEIHFNLSHSVDKVMVCLSDGELGCDIEKIRQAEPKLAERFFTSGEAAALRALPLEEQAEAFCRLWTLKESFLKLTGRGLALPMNAFELDLIGERVTVRQNALDVRCFFGEFSVYDGYRCALCSLRDAAEAVWETVEPDGAALTDEPL